MPLVNDLAALPPAVVQLRSKSGLKPDNGQLTELIAAVCTRILDKEPALVADVAAGRSSRQSLISLIQRTAAEESNRMSPGVSDLQAKVLDFLFGYGQLQPYIDDDQMSDIDGTGPDEFSIKIGGKRSKLQVSFPDSQTYETFCRLAIIRNGGIINENDSHCRVTDERHRLRINVAVPPRSVKHASISIRKHRKNGYSLQDLRTMGMLDDRLVILLKDMACSASSVLFSGKGAAGKTTLLRAFVQEMPEMERVLIAESDSEIYPDKPHCLVQRIRKPNEGGRPVSLRDLIADGLTMSLDTYIIGEIVGGEAMEFMRAAFSGHRCLATTHANCARDALERLLTLARPSAQGESEQLMRRMLASGIDYLVHLQSFKVTDVLRVSSDQKKEDDYELVQVWKREQNPPSDPSAGQRDVPLVSGS